MATSQSDDTPEVTQLTTRVAYRNPWLRIREDTVRRADGSEGLYGVVERPDFAIVVPFQDGAVTMVEQYRYPIGRRLWELPMGTVESGEASPETIAATELQQETGLVAAEMTFICSLYQAPGFCNQLGHVFLATGLRQGQVDREASEQGMLCRAFSMTEIEDMIRSGALQDGMTLAALGMLRMRGVL